MNNGAMYKSGYLMGLHTVVQLVSSDLQIFVRCLLFFTYVYKFDHFVGRRDYVILTPASTRDSWAVELTPL